MVVDFGLSRRTAKKDISGAVFFGYLAAVFLAAVSGGVFWLLFYSTYAANAPSVIVLRNWYQRAYWEVKSLFLPKQNEYLPFDPIYTIRTDSLSNGRYKYRFLGRPLAFDKEGKTAALRGFDGRVYNFLVDEQFAEDKQVVEIVWYDKRTLRQIMRDYLENPSFVLNIND